MSLNIPSRVNSRSFSSSTKSTKSSDAKITAKSTKVNFNSPPDKSTAHAVKPSLQRKTKCEDSQYIKSRKTLKSSSLSNTPVKSNIIPIKVSTLKLNEAHKSLIPRKSKTPPRLPLSNLPQIQKNHFNKTSVLSSPSMKESKLKVHKSISKPFSSVLENTCSDLENSCNNNKITLQNDLDSLEVSKGIKDSYDINVVEPKSLLDDENLNKCLDTSSNKSNISLSTNVNISIENGEEFYLKDNKFNDQLLNNNKDKNLTEPVCQNTFKDEKISKILCEDFNSQENEKSFDNLLAEYEEYLNKSVQDPEIEDYILIKDRSFQKSNYGNDKISEDPSFHKEIKHINNLIKDCMITEKGGDDDFHDLHPIKTFFNTNFLNIHKDLHSIYDYKAICSMICPNSYNFLVNSRKNSIEINSPKENIETKQVE